MKNTPLNNQAIIVSSARVLTGSAMGCPQGTMVLGVQAHPVKAEDLLRARQVLAHQLPRWITPSHPVDPALSASDTPAVLALLIELVQAIQLELNIPIARFSATVTGSGLDSHLKEVFLPVHNKMAAVNAFNFSVKTLNELLQHKTTIPLPEAIRRIKMVLKPHSEAGVNNFFILQAAYALGIPVFKPIRNLHVLGTGKKSQWLQSLVTDDTSFLGVQFAQDKQLTASLLRATGLPGSEHHLVHNEAQALAAAERLGYPIVVKPADSDRGAGVAAGLQDAAGVAQAFAAALKVSRRVLVERWQAGHTHRLTVQDGEVIRAVRRIAGGVTGDGVHTLEELVNLFQQTPQQQRFADRYGRTPLSLDEEALSLLKEHGLKPDSRPEPGQYIKLRRRDNVNAGGTNQELPVDDPAAIHPDNLKLAIDAAQIMRLNFAGIDLITTDISRSWLEIGALICEVNARPQMGATLHPDLYPKLLRRLFPQGASVHASLVVVPEDTAVMTAPQTRDHFLQPEATVSSRQGLWHQGQRLTPGFNNTYDAALSVLQRPDVNQAICLLTPQDIHRFGLPIAHWDAVTVLDKPLFNTAEQSLLKVITPWWTQQVPH